jgi:Tol biopolymer transport system component
LAFDCSSAADGIHNIYSINSDDSNPTNLTKTPKFDEAYPDFSPDGSRMCFNFENFSISGAPASGIYVMNANGSDPTLLIKSPNIEMVAEPGACDWSPHGTKIVFSGAFKKFDDSEVYVINADGSGRTALTSNLGEDRAPDWSPDGTKITFTRATYCSALTINPSDVYTMDADGSDVAQITKTPDVDEQDPDWQPLPRPPSSKSRSETVHPPDTGGPSLLLVASALLFSGGLMFYAGVKRRM